jgi:hypothetical protein
MKASRSAPSWNSDFRFMADTETQVANGLRFCFHKGYIPLAAA